MKKNGLTIAVIAGIAGVAGVGNIADAVNLNPDGLGQVLLYPYYTSQGGNNTLISVVNTAEVGKAVKVRFLEGRNSREVLDFHLYLSPFDVWTGAIATNAAAGLAGDGAGITTTDRSCTVPDIARGGLGYDRGAVRPIGDGRYFVPFVNFAYTGQYADLGPVSTSRTREGYLEIIEMADINPAGSVHAWSLHNAAGEPGNCLNLNKAWYDNGGQFQLDPTFGLLSPSGQGELFGNGMIVNPDRGTILGYSADAIEGFNYANLHAPPGDTDPGIDAVNNPAPDADATAYVFRFGQLITATYPDDVSFGKVDAISALYASPRVVNEYYLDEGTGIAGNSEWVLNFPTKRYYVDNKPSLPNGAPFATVRAPFANAFGADGSCQNVTVTIYDREEDTVTTGGGGFSPRPPGPAPDALCWEAQVITFNQTEEFIAGSSNILGSTYAKNVETEYESGWAFVNFSGAPAMRASSEGIVFNGLPVTGFFATNYDNADLTDGVLANYSTLFRHRTERVCSGSDACS